MERTVRLGDLVFALEGLALLRHLFDSDDGVVGARLEELGRLIAERDSPPLSLGVPTVEHSVSEGYAAWAAGYDDLGNGLIIVEHPVMCELLDGIPSGRALDAACGTGRLTAELVARGHQLIGIDASPQMLARARERLPGADLRVADLSAIPLDDDSVDLAVCGLALSHAADLAATVQELTRVVRRGGRLLLSDIHPLALQVTSGEPFYPAGDGRFAVIRSHLHLHSEYLDAFRAAGLRVLRCIEPLQTERTAALLPAYGIVPEATAQAIVGLPLALIWDLAND